MKQRIEVAFADPNPCGVRSAKQDVEDMGDQGWTKLYEERDKKCDEKKRADDWAVFLAHCDELGAAIDGSSTDGVSKAYPGANDDTTMRISLRIASHKLTFEDLHIGRDHLACPDVVWPRLTKALANDIKVWSAMPPASTGASLDMPSDMTTALGAVGLRADVEVLVRQRAESIAQSVAAKTRLEDTSAANAACKQVQDLQLEVGPACAALMKRHGIVVAAANAKDAAQEKARSAADESRTAASLEAQKRGLFACTTQCNRARSDAQLATEAACREQCNGDISCSGACRKTSPCELRCMQQYPDATNDLATQMGL
jgi:hypothetical protein